MIKADITKELETLRQRVAELEGLQTKLDRKEESPQRIGAEERYSAILESFDDGLLVLDRKDKVIDANSKIEKITGYQRRDLVGETALSLARLFTHKGLTVFWRNPLRRTVDPNAQPYEIDVFKKSGELVTVQIKYHPLKVNSKNVGCLVILRDVTALRRAERESGNSQEVYKSLVSHAGVGIFRTTPGVNGRFLEVNPAVEAITGYSREELLQMNVADLYVHPEERDEHVREVLSRKLTKPWEVRFKKKDGTAIIVRDSKVAVRGNDGKTLYLEGFFEDITERKRAEEALEASEQNLRNFFDNSLMGIRIRTDGYIEYANQALLDIFGCENIDELIAIPPEKRYTAECYADFLVRQKKISSGESVPNKIDVDIVRKDGMIRHLQIFGKQLYWKGKIQTQTFYNDITERKQEELKITNSERLYRLVAENVTDVIWKVNLDSPSQLNYISPSVTRLLGYTVAEAMNKKTEEIFSPASFKKVMKVLAEEMSHLDREQIDQHRSITLELELKHNDGFWVITEVNFTLIRDTDGWPVEILAVGRDITGRKRAEAQIRQSETKYSTLVEKGNDGVVIIQDGLLSFANFKMTNITGTPPEESVGRSFVDFVSPKYRTFVADNYKRRIKGENAAGRYEIEILTKEGNCIPVEICANAIEYEGKPADMAVIRDITERKQAEEALRASEDKYSTLIEQSSDGILILNGSLIEFANRKIYEISGYYQKEVLGKNFSELISSESNEIILERKRRKLAGEPVPPNYELEIITKDHRKISVETTIQPITYKGISARMVIVRDISERIQAEKQIKESEQSLKTYLENAPDGIYLSDLKGIFLYGNKKAEEILGYKKEELVGNNFLKLNLLPAKYLIKASKLLALNAMGKNTGPDEFELNRKDKSLAWVEINTTIVKQKDKQIVIGFVRDIAERKKAELALQLSEQNFRNSMDHTLVGIRISDIDNNTLYSNQTLLDIFGYNNIDEVRTKSPQEYYSTASYAVYLEMREKYGRGEIIPDQVDINISRKDGTIRHLQALFKIVLWNGKQQYQTLYNDITERKKMELALQENEEKYRLIVENTRDVIFTLNTEGEFVYLSPSIIDTLGYDPTDLIGKAFISLVHPEDKHLIEEEIEQGTTGGYQITKNREYRVRHASGEWRWCISRGTRVVDSSGNFIYFIGMARDITEQRQIEANLRASEENFRNSIDSSLMGIHIVDKDWNTLYANQAFLDLYGYENIDELRASHQEDRYTPESYASWVLRHEKMLRSEPVPDKIEADIVRKDGSIRHILSFRKEVLWNGKTRFQLLYNDITEQKQAQERIEQAAREWRSTFDSITDLISIQDKDNRIIRVNKAVADLLHKTPQELIGKFCREVMRGDQDCPTNCPHLLALKTGKPSSLEMFNSNLGVHFQESASPLFNEKGEITGTVLVARDVTQQKRMEEQLVMTDRLASIGELSSGIAHELNNPLTSVIGFSQLLMEGDVPANMKEDLGTVYSEAQRAAAIVKNLLTFARKHAPVKQLSQVNTVIEDVLRLRAYEQKVNNIEVENRLAPNLPEIMIDNFQMQQVFLNIMVNAEFAMLEAHHKGKLIIATEKTDGVIKITFNDDGPGIAEENLKHIFDPFFTTKEVGKGTGLGLSICHGIVTEHGGQIYATSEKGQGATFVVELPLINEQ